MMWAHVTGVLVDDVTRIPPDKVFDPSYAATFFPCGDSVQSGMTINSWPAPAKPTQWLPKTIVVLRQSMNAGANTYICATAGITGIVAPTGTGTGITDGTVVWDYVPPVPATPPTISAIAFMMAFYPTEQAYIQNSTDPIVQVFWTRYQACIQTGTPIDLAMPSMTQTLDYLSTTNVQPALTPPAPYIVPSRVAQILTGQPV